MKPDISILVPTRGRYEESALISPDYFRFCAKWWTNEIVGIAKRHKVPIGSIDAAGMGMILRLCWEQTITRAQAKECISDYLIAWCGGIS